MTVSAPYYGDSAVMRTPPPDLPSLLLKERIVYLGLPLFSDDDAKRQMGIDVTELIIAQLLYLTSDDPERDINLYVNSPGGVAEKTRSNIEQVKARGGHVIAVGSDRESLALADGERDAGEDALIRLAANLLGVNDRDSALARQRVAARQ